jgi:alanyl-tRNA synthetase
LTLNIKLQDTVNVTDAQLKTIESQVNEKIREAVSVEVKVYEGDAIPDQVRILL